MMMDEESPLVLPDEKWEEGARLAVELLGIHTYGLDDETNYIHTTRALIDESGPEGDGEVILATIIALARYGGVAIVKCAELLDVEPSVILEQMATAARPTGPTEPL